MPNLKHEKRAPGEVSDVSEFPPYTSRGPNNQSGRRPLLNKEGEPPHTRTSYKSSSPPFADPRSPFESSSQSAYHNQRHPRDQPWKPPHFSPSRSECPRTPPPYYHLAAYSRTYSPTQYPSWRPNQQPGYPYRPNSSHSGNSSQSGFDPSNESSELKKLVGSLRYENEGLRDELRHQLAWLKEQLGITERQSGALEEQSKELKDSRTEVTSLKTNITSLDKELAVKCSEIKELKEKNEVCKRSVSEHQDKSKKLEGRAKMYEKEIEEKRAELKNALAELGMRQSEIRRGKQWLTKMQRENRNGRALVANLRSEKQEILKELKQCQNRKGKKYSLKSTLTDAMANINEQDKKIEGLVLNISMQKIECDQIIDFLISCYRNLFKDFRQLQDTKHLESELKKATTDSFAVKPKFNHVSVGNHRSVGEICMECKPNFARLETLVNRFQILSGQPIELVALPKSEAQLKEVVSKLLE